MCFLMVNWFFPLLWTTVFIKLGNCTMLDSKPSPTPHTFRFQNTQNCLRNEFYNLNYFQCSPCNEPGDGDTNELQPTADSKWVYWLNKWRCSRWADILLTRHFSVYNEVKKCMLNFQLRLSFEWQKYPNYVATPQRAGRFDLRYEDHVKNFMHSTCLFIIEYLIDLANNEDISLYVTWFLIWQHSD